MTEYVIYENTVWVLAEKGHEIGDRGEWKLWDSDRLHLAQENLPGSGDGLLIFNDLEWAEKYIRDSRRQDLEQETVGLSAVNRLLQGVVPETHLSDL